MKSEILELLRFNDKIDNQTSFASVVLENDKIVILALENDNEILKKELEANDFKSFFGEINNKVVFGYDIKSIYRHFLSLGCSEKELSEVQIYDILLSSYISNCNTTHSFEDILTRFNTKLELMDDQIKTSKIENILLIGLDYYFSFDDKLRFLWKNIESDSSLPLAIMEHIGVKFDSQKLLDLKDRYIIEKNEIEQKIKDLLSDQNINLNSSVQLGTALINAGFALKQTGKSGNVSTNESVLEELKIADTTGVIDLILEYRAISKMISTYTDSLLERVNKNTQRINGTYIQTGSATGRLASINPNLQNIPIKNPKFGPDLRACFITDSDKYLVSFDYSQIELRILAHCSDDDELIRAFENNIDIHTLTAARIFDKNVNEITKKERSVGKTLNFALMYQQGYLATAKQLSISNKESKEYHAKYFEKFVKIKPFIDQTIQFAKENGYVETIYGRKSYYPDINSTDPFIQSNAKRAAFNMPIQGTEADIVKLAMNKILAFFIEKNLNSKMLMQIHDEIVLEVPKSELEIILKAIPKIMLLDNPLKVPLIVEYHYGDNWNQK
jgi:DNA polymerase-1